VGWGRLQASLTSCRSNHWNWSWGQAMPGGGAEQNSRQEGILGRVGAVSPASASLQRVSNASAGSTPRRRLPPRRLLSRAQSPATMPISLCPGGPSVPSPPLPPWGPRRRGRPALGAGAQSQPRELSARRRWGGGSSAWVDGSGGPGCGLH
jgi:hypothetical protein